MSSVSAACIFDAYSASSAHTDTFYIVSQIVRVRNSKRHFFSKLTFPYIIQPLCFTLRSHRPQPPRFHPTATSTTARHFAQQSRLNSSSENFSYFFKKALDKYPKTVYNIYCYLGVAQIGSALPWGGRGRRFKSCHSDQTTASRKRSGSLFYWRYMAYGVALRVRSRSFDFLHTFVVGNEYPYNFRAFLKFLLHD